MPIELAQQPTISQGDRDTVAIDYTPILERGETLTGTPTVQEIDTSDLSISNVVVSSTDMEILSRTAKAKRAVLFVVSGQLSGTTYRMRVRAETSAGRVFVRDALLECL